MPEFLEVPIHMKKFLYAEKKKEKKSVNCSGGTGT